VVIGISYEQARLATIHPQPWDIPVDYLVTERGVYRRDPEGLAFLGEPQSGDEPSTLSSPVCYAGEVKRD
jgi:5-formyltetrahydrofolate cyclo-ligase